METPVQIWVKLLQGYEDLDYLWAVNFLKDSDFDPFTYESNLFNTCIITILQNPDLPYNQLPRHLSILIDYLLEFHKAQTTRVMQYFNPRKI